VEEPTRTADTPELPTLVMRQIAYAIREYYAHCEFASGPSVQHLVLHSAPGDSSPLTALLIVLPENAHTSTWIEDMNTHAARSWDTLCQWAAITEQQRRTNGGR